MISPQIRANWSKQTLRHVRRLPAVKRDAILALIGDESVREIRAAGILAWLPAVHQARLFDAIFKVLAQTGAAAFWRDAMLANFNTPLLSPLVQGGLRLFGATPYSIVRMSPRAWQLVTRGCGTQHVAEGDAGDVAVHMDFGELPAELSRPGFVAHCLGNCDAVLQFLHLRGTVAETTTRLERGAFSLDIRDVQSIDERAAQ
jgi:hypothetical protein